MSGSGQPHSACSVDTALEPRITTSSAFGIWKEITSTAINRLITSANTKNGQLSDGEKAEFEVLQKDVFNTLACLQEKQMGASSTTNDIHTSQARILELQEQLKQREEEVQIAKDRVAYIRDPDARPSYYQSWFPMDRPMRPTSIPIFIGIVVFFSMFIFMAILSVVGINISVLSAPGSSSFSLLQWMQAQLTPGFWLVFVILVSVIIYFRARN
jgi:hypothetical protein